MSSVIDSFGVPGGCTIRFRRRASGQPAGEGHRAKSDDTALRLSTTPLSDPAEIFRRMPAQAITPAPLELLDVISGPILLTRDGPVGELREIAPAKPVLARAA
jgi:hypothetical protein